MSKRLNYRTYEYQIQEQSFWKYVKGEKYFIVFIMLIGILSRNIDKNNTISIVLLLFIGFVLLNIISAFLVANQEYF